MTKDTKNKLYELLCSNNAELAFKIAEGLGYDNVQLIEEIWDEFRGNFTYSATNSEDKLEFSSNWTLSYESMWNDIRVVSVWTLTDNDRRDMTSGKTNCIEELIERLKYGGRLHQKRCSKLLKLKS